MTDDLEFGVDISNWSGYITAAQAECWKREGIRFVVCGTQVFDTCRQQLAVATEAGLKVEAYVYLYLDGDPEYQVRAARRTISGFPVDRLWLDFEDSDPCPMPIIDFIRKSVSACGDFPCGIYTGSWWWTPRMGQTTEFAHLPLWIAHYDGVAKLDSPPLAPGWYPTMKQYRGSHELCGVTVDVNVRRKTVDCGLYALALEWLDRCRELETLVFNAGEQGANPTALRLIAVRMNQIAAEWEAILKP